MFCIVFGCQQKFSQGADRNARVCPRCHNASVTGGKKRTWLELCFIPVVPIHSSQVWVCTICHWEVNQKDGAPASAGAAPGYPGYQAQPSYQQQHSYQQSGFAQAYPTQK